MFIKVLPGLVTGLYWILLSLPANADGMQDLQRFYRQVTSYQARFDQAVLDENLTVLETSHGQFWIERPGKFRWHYQQPSEQLIVGDGKEVWIYDVELEQITHRRSDNAVSDTPAVLLAGEGDLDASFTIEDLGQQGKLDWIRMLPKKKDSGFTDIRIGFEEGELRLLEMIDTFDQTTRMRFMDVNENADIPPGTFSFEAPPGVDIIRENG